MREILLATFCCLFLGVTSQMRRGRGGVGHRISQYRRNYQFRRENLQNRMKRMATAPGLCENGKFVVTGTGIECECNEGYQLTANGDQCEDFLCPAKTRFTCRDGTCISKAKVCNRRNDCSDGEDEIDCDDRAKCRPRDEDMARLNGYNCVVSCQNRSSRCQEMGTKCKCDDECGRSCVNRRRQCTADPPKVNQTVRSHVIRVSGTYRRRISSKPYYYGDVATYVCEPGLSLRGPLPRCNGLGNWSDEIPLCIDSRCHDAPPHVYHSVDVYATRTIGGRTKIIRSPPFHPGDVFTYICEQGRILQGPPPRCNEDGIWSWHVPGCFVNECNRYPDACNNGICVDTRDRFVCNCNIGFIQDETGQRCIDIDECEISTGLCENGECVNNFIGGFECMCDEGYELTPDGKQCQVNECNRYPDACNNGICVDTRDRFVCNCNIGFIEDETGQRCIDIDECRISTELCENGECVNFEGGFECLCDDGYLLMANGYRCQDRRTGDCFLNVEGEDIAPICSQAIGIDMTRANCCCTAFAQGWGSPCEYCPERNTSKYMTLCRNGDGFKPNPINHLLEDIDECVVLPGLCQSGECVNVFGSFVCECPRGYALKEESRVCEDVDECALDENVCWPGTCHNLDGGYSCLCPDGWRPILGGGKCEVKDACITYPDLCENGICENTPEGFWCICNTGFTENETEGNCIDIDECDISVTGLCENGECVNFIGGFECLCDEGYELAADGVQCEE